VIDIPDVTIDASDVEEQIRLLARIDEVTERHLRPAMQQSIDEVASGWRSVIPSVTGTYEGSIEGKVMSVVGSRARAVASTGVRRDGKFPYPAALETSPSGRGTRTYIWQSGRLAKGTVTGVLREKADRILQRVADALERIVNELVVP
jgi:hypothetical protein